MEDDWGLRTLPSDDVSSSPVEVSMLTETFNELGFLVKPPVLEEVALPSIDQVGEGVCGSNAWIESFCHVCFDVNKGHSLVFQWPPNSLSVAEGRQVALLSLPDSGPSVSSLGEEVSFFTFRLRRDTEEELDADNIGSQSFLYGFTLFRTLKDFTADRFCKQESFVLLSNILYLGFFQEILRFLSKQYFILGEGAIKSAFEQIGRWPHPSPNLSLSMEIGEEQFVFETPNSIRHIFKAVSMLSNSREGKGALNGAQSSASCLSSFEDQESSNGPGVSSSPCSQLNGTLRMKSFFGSLTFQEVNVYESFKQFIDFMWLLWELVLIGEPILVVASSAMRCSEYVLSLVSLIEPVMFQGDYRPYFNTFDPDFNLYRKFCGNSRIPAVILGVSNPFFLETLHSFPTQIVQGMRGRMAKCEKRGKRGLRATLPIKHTPSMPVDSYVYTRYTPCLAKDYLFLKKLLISKQSSEGMAGDNEFGATRSLSAEAHRAKFEKSQSSAQKLGALAASSKHQSFADEMSYNEGAMRSLHFPKFSKNPIIFSAKTRIESKEKHQLEENSCSSEQQSANPPFTSLRENSSPDTTSVYYSFGSHSPSNAHTHTNGEASSHRVFHEDHFRTKRYSYLSTINNQLIRQYFISLTNSFLEPLKVFMQVDLSSFSIPFGENPCLREFQMEEFIGSFSPVGPFKAVDPKKLRLLYRRFIESENFLPWLSAYAEELNNCLHLQYLSICLKAGLSYFPKEIDSHLLIDAYSNITYHMWRIKYRLRESQIEQLNELLERIKEKICEINSLPAYG